MNDFISINQASDGVVDKLDALRSTPRQNINCERHGISNALINGKCELCRDEQDNKQDLHFLKINQTNAGVGLRYINSTLDNLILDDATPQFKNMIHELKNYNFKTNNIIITGKTGIGKTHIGIALINKALLMNFTAQYINFYNLSKISIDSKDKFKKCLECQFLVIDEFGTNETNYKQEVLRELIDYRYSNLKPTLIISNLLYENIYKNVDESIKYRIEQDCLAFFDINSKNYREI